VSPARPARSSAAAGWASAGSSRGPCERIAFYRRSNAAWMSRR